MNSSKLNFLIIILSLLCFVHCKKDDDKRLHNVALGSKSVNEVRAIIRGDWFIVRGTVCGFAGCQTGYYDPNNADIISFLQHDTLKQTAHSGTPVYRYEKADSVKLIPSFYLNESAWTFYYSTPLAFTKIQNDTLVVETGYGEMGLIRKK